MVTCLLASKMVGRRLKERLNVDMRDKPDREAINYVKKGENVQNQSGYWTTLSMLTNFQKMPSSKCH